MLQAIVVVADLGVMLIERGLSFPIFAHYISECEEFRYVRYVAVVQDAHRGALCDAII